MYLSVCLVWVFSLGVLPALFHFVSLFMFLSFSLFHLEGYRIRLNDPPVSGIPSCLRVNRVLLSESLKLFSMLSRRTLHNLICLSLLLAKYFFIAASPALSFLWLIKIQHAGLTHRFQVSIVSCLFLIVCLFLYLPLICFRLCLHRSAFACS